MLKAIPILEKFSICSMIMPYYAPTHFSFLLLSQLNSRSRAMLDEFYEEVLNWMLNTAIWILISEENKVMMSLPCDLFKFSIDLKNEGIVEMFLQLIDNIRQNKGFYFNSHFMHSRLWIVSLYVDSDLVSKLYPSLELLKQTKIISDISWDEKLFSYQRAELMDMFSLRMNTGFSGTDQTLTFPHFCNKSEDNTKLKPEFALFKRIFYINLLNVSFGRSMSVLEDIKTLQLKLDWLSIWSNSLEESELVSSSEYYK